MTELVILYLIGLAVHTFLAAITPEPVTRTDTVIVLLWPVVWAIVFVYLTATIALIVFVEPFVRAGE